MKTTQPLRAAICVLAVLGFATSAIAQVSADKLGKSTSGNTPAATPVTPGAPGHTGSTMGSGSAGNADDMAYGRYWTSMDANADGKVTREEYMAYHTERWERNDATKRGYSDRDGLRALYLDREMSKTDGHPAGSPLNLTTKK